MADIDSEDFTQFNDSFQEILSFLPDFERKFADSLSTKKKYSIFSCILERYNNGISCNDTESTCRAKKSFIRSLLEELVLHLHGIYNEMFSEISLEKAKKIAKESVIRDPTIPSSKLTYGEIDFFSFVAILERLEPKNGDKFLDLGHGTGRAIVCTALLYGNIFDMISGVEIIPELYAASQVVIANLTEVYCRYSDIFAAHSADVVVREGDFTIPDFVDWSSAGILCSYDLSTLRLLISLYFSTHIDIIFANSTCFDDDLMDFLSEKATDLKEGARIVTLTKMLDSPYLQLIDQRQYAMSWGAATCFVHKRK
jgi:SAM-dependent methyltransferase